MKPSIRKGRGVDYWFVTWIVPDVFSISQSCKTWQEAVNVALKWLRGRF